jgi:hypothetical protein
VRQPSGCLAAIVAGLIGAALVSGCGQPSQPQQTADQTPREPKEQPRNDAEEKAWAEATRAGTAEAFTTYLRTHGSGPHAAEARQRLAVLEARARKAAEEKAAEEKKAWAEASGAGTAAALTAYLKTYGSGSYAAEARQRLAALKEQARTEAEEQKAWAEASAAGTATALTAYLKTHGSGVNAAEARQRLTALEEQARKEAEEKDWAEASRAGTVAAIAAYLKTHGSGAHAAEARQRLAALQEQVGKQDETLRRKKAAAVGLPALDVQKSCRAMEAAIKAMKTQLSKDTYDICVRNQIGARDVIVKQWSEFSQAERTQCINPRVYMPSYVEWLTCLEMQRDVRKLRQEATTAKKKR